MADYYPLISRAVAGLEKNNGENRRALYERARAALLAQLRGVTPALNESDITRERLALEESIRKVEAESARQFVEASRQARAAKVRSIEPRSTLSRPSALSPDLGRQPGAPSPPPTLPDAQQSDSIFDRPLRPEPSLRQPPRRFGAEPRALISDAGLREAPSVAKEAGAASARADTSGR